MAWLLLSAFAAPPAGLWILGDGAAACPGREGRLVAAVVASLAFVAALAGIGRFWGDGRAPAVVGSACFWTSPCDPGAAAARGR